MNKLNLDERVLHFKTFRLPGQPMATHMGTHYLINDLNDERLRLTERVKQFEAFRRGVIAFANAGDQSTDEEVLAVIRINISARNSLAEECERLRQDERRLNFVDEKLCRPGDVMGKDRQVIGIMKCWQVVTQCNDSLRDTIDLLNAELSKDQQA